MQQIAKVAHWHLDSRHATHARQKLKKGLEDYFTITSWKGAVCQH